MPKPTREETAQLDRQRKALDGIADRVRSHHTTDAYRQGWDRIQWPKREESDDER